MSWIPARRQRSHEATMRAARTMQALTIEAVDRLVPVSHESPGPLTRMVGVSFDLTAAFMGEPAEFVDQSYALVERLTRLHREFAQRLFEVFDPRSDAPRRGEPDNRTIAPVVRLRVR